MGLLSNLIQRMIQPLSSNPTWKEYLEAVNELTDNRLLYTLRHREQSALQEDQESEPINADMVDIYYNGLPILSNSPQYQYPISLKLPFDTNSFATLNLGVILKNISQQDLVFTEDGSSFYVDYPIQDKFAHITGAKVGTHSFGGIVFKPDYRVIPYYQSGVYKFGDVIVDNDNEFIVLGYLEGSAWVRYSNSFVYTGTHILRRYFGPYKPNLTGFNKMLSDVAEVNEMVDSCVPINVLEKNQVYVLTLSNREFEFLSYASYTPGVSNANVALLTIQGNDAFTIENNVSWLHITDNHGNEITEYVGSIPLTLVVDTNLTFQPRTVTVYIRTVHCGVITISVVQAALDINVAWNLPSTQLSPIVWSKESKPQVVAHVIVSIPWTIFIQKAKLTSSLLWYTIDNSDFNNWTTEQSGNSIKYETTDTGEGDILFDAALSTFDEDVTGSIRHSFVPSTENSNEFIFNREIQIYPTDFPTQISHEFFKVIKYVGARFYCRYQDLELGIQATQFVSFNDELITQPKQIFNQVYDATYMPNQAAVMLLSNYTQQFPKALVTNCSSWLARLVNEDSPSEVVEQSGSGNADNTISLGLPANYTGETKSWRFEFFVGQFVFAQFNINQLYQSLSDCVATLTADPSEPILWNTDATNILYPDVTVNFKSSDWRRDIVLYFYFVGVFANDGSKRYVKYMKSVTTSHVTKIGEVVMATLTTTEYLNIPFEKSGHGTCTPYFWITNHQINSNDGLVNDLTMNQWDGYIESIPAMAYKQFNVQFVWPN